MYLCQYCPSYNNDDEKDQYWTDFNLNFFDYDSQVLFSNVINDFEPGKDFCSLITPEYIVFLECKFPLYIVGRPRKNWRFSRSAAYNTILIKRKPLSCTESVQNKRPHERYLLCGDLLG